MEKKKIITKGIGASSGKFYGKALKLFTNDHLVLDTHLPPEEIEAEIKKFFTCLKKTRKELEQIIDKQARGLDEDLVDILNSQVYMLEDPLLIEGVENRIRKNRENAVLALYHTIEEISKSFSDLKDEYLRERAVDIRDIGKRLGEALSGEKYDYTALSKLDSEVILVANELTPSQIVHMDKTMVKAIATDLGGRTGHMAILAKNFGIPAVVGLKDITAKVKENEYILVDAENGTVVQNAGIGEIKLYATSSPFQTKEEFKREDKAPSQTKDGHHVSIKVNLETPSDCPTAIRNGAEGIGLYRSETLFLEHEDQCPTEEGQFRAYQKIAKGMKNRPVIIRTFDLGADKFELDFHEDNPFLGNRGIRYCLQNKPMFKTQLNAILRASAFGNLSIMLPMISNAKEIRETRELIEECKTDLTKKNIPFKKDIQLGIMIETPSAAMSIDLLMKDADFFSIGTNDLLQYTMAVDRNNSALSDLYNPYNIAFLRLLSHIIKFAKENDKPVSICGELASDTNFTILLIGFGLRDFSVSLPFVKKIKNIVIAIDIPQAKSLAKEVLKLAEQEKYTEIEAFLFNKHLV